LVLSFCLALYRCLSLVDKYYADLKGAKYYEIL